MTAAFSTVKAAGQAQEGFRSFYFAVGNYYQVTVREVAAIHDSAIPPEEVPVVFYLAQQAHVAPAVVVDLRRHGGSWADVAFHLHLAADIYDFGTRAPGYSKQHPPRDEDVIDAVNVHFLADYHRVSPEVVWAERSRGRTYAAVARDFEAKGSKGKGHDR